MDYYIVISSQDEYCAKIEQFLEKMVKDDKEILVIKEFGKLGNHPHYNIIIRNSSVKRTDKHTERIKRQLRKLDIPDSPNLVKTKLVTAIEGVIDYVTKEINHIVLARPEWFTRIYDLVKERRKYVVGRAFTWKDVLNKVNFTPVAVQYIRDNYKSDKYDIELLFRDMTKSRIKCLHLARHYREFQLEIDLILKGVSSVSFSELYDKK